MQDPALCKVILGCGKQNVPKEEAFSCNCVAGGARFSRLGSSYRDELVKNQATTLRGYSIKRRQPTARKFFSPEARNPLQSFPLFPTGGYGIMSKIRREWAR